MRPRLEALFGPFPSSDRAKPPAIVHRGTVTGNGFTVEKLLVATRTNYYVPAALWLPDASNTSLGVDESAGGNNPSNAKIPGILLPVGHEGPAFRWNG